MSLKNRPQDLCRCYTKRRHDWHHSSQGLPAAGTLKSSSKRAYPERGENKAIAWGRCKEPKPVGEVRPFK